MRIEGKIEGLGLVVVIVLHIGILGMMVVIETQKGIDLKKTVEDMMIIAIEKDEEVEVEIEIETDGLVEEANLQTNENLAMKEQIGDEVIIVVNVCQHQFPMSKAREKRALASCLVQSLRLRTQRPPALRPRLLLLKLI